MRTYAAEIIDNTVMRAIVGNASWAVKNLGGEWVDSPTKVGIGWELYEDGLRPPQPYPSWSWVNGEWIPPEPYPNDDSSYFWVEDSGWTIMDGGQT